VKWARRPFSLGGMSKKSRLAEPRSGFHRVRSLLLPQSVHPIMRAQMYSRYGLPGTRLRQSQVAADFPSHLQTHDSTRRFNGCIHLCTPEAPSVDIRMTMLHQEGLCA